MQWTPLLPSEALLAHDVYVFGAPERSPLFKVDGVHREKKGERKKRKKREKQKQSEKETERERERDRGIERERER